MSSSISYLSEAYRNFVDFMNTTKPGEWCWNDQRILKEAKSYTRWRDEKLWMKFDDVKLQFKVIEANAKDLSKLFRIEEDSSSQES